MQSLNVSLYLLMLYIQLFTKAIASTSPLIVRVEEGLLRGVENKSVLTGESYCAFLGIPYAKPPVGELRFKAPVPGEKWKGVRDASKEGSECLQMSSYYNATTTVGSEDCLFLNVYTPKAPRDIQNKKAVMIYIFGGAYTIGSAGLYSPDFLIGHDIILVTINYRLNVLGFLNTNTPSSPGNAALKDQSLAIKWVRKNIANFGGDPENVTLFGESAGAASVHYQMLSPSSRGLFRRAIAQSGVVLGPGAIVENPEFRARQIGKLAGYDGNDMEELVRHLRHQTGETLVKLAYQIHQDALRKAPAQCLTLTFVPSIERIKEGAFLPDHPENLMKSAPPIPFLVGLNNQEGVFFIQSVLPTALDTILADPSLILKDNFELDRFEQLLNEMKAFYFKNEPPTREAIVKVYTDLQFVMPFYDSIRYLIESPVPPYIYVFSYEGTFNFEIMQAKQTYKLNLTGAAHGDELGYQFFWGQLPIDQANERDKKVINNLCTLWTNFAKDGNPASSVPQIDWKPLTRKNSCYVDIKDKLTVFKEVLYKDRYDFWRKWSRKFIRYAK